ncbi:TonB C-terminal domain-containing protein [Aquabacterium sp.]|uniref:TonB C-terminal domain-containing protein n=1 Tax=Aquabacterium sp. TaxID=1872578 RepID=UPI0024891078|nr:TonB C-terminal domain-containing protein [Aquabacterium sp.]MDI1350794.1 TonB C-terminal domain-containing protein [Aquabacterium sp.]
MSAPDMDRGDQAAEDTQDGGAKRFIVPVVLVLALVVASYLIYSQMGKGGGGPKRQTVKIAVLPDTPPPPPPPPKDEKKPEPKPEENKPQQQEQKPVEAPPEPQQLKMEGAAGDGPSAFSAGSVNSEYKGGAIGTGTGGGTLADKLAFSGFGNSARREINEFLNRDQALKRSGDYKLPVSLWVRADGSIERFELDATSGNPDIDNRLRQALGQFRGFRNPPPAGLPQPIRLQVTNRMTG